LQNALKRDIIYHKIFSIRSLKKTGANAPFFVFQMKTLKNCIFLQVQNGKKVNKNGALK